MIRDITLGQYYASKSFVHKLDPRIKILATLFYIVDLFVVNSFLMFAFCFVVLFIALKVAKVPFSYIFRGLKPILIILILTFCLNIFMVDGEVIWQWHALKITHEGILTACFMAIRLILLILGSSLLTLTTTPIRLTDAIERLLSPFTKIGLPAHDIAMMMSIALRFIPTLLEEADKIMKAQQARGADFETGGIMKRAKALIPILVPLFVSAFRIAQDLAMAMEARCYRGGEGRTRLHEMKLVKSDKVVLVLIFAFTAVIILGRIFI